MNHPKAFLSWTLIGLGLLGCGGDTAAPPVAVVSVVVSPAQVTLRILETVQLEASISDASGAFLSGRTVTWSSSNAEVATVSSSGLVTGASEGTVTITATSEGANGTAQVSVTPAAVASVDVTPAIATVNANERIQFSATPRDQLGGALEGRTVSWSSGDDGIAMVDEAGLVIGVAGGDVGITATVEDQSGIAALEVTPAVDAAVESDDGRRTLDIPAGALPPGVAAEDIKITDSPGMLEASDGELALAVILLEPAGLEFSEPVTLTVRDLPMADPLQDLFVLHTFGDDAEIITDPVTVLDPQTNTLTASISITHFSIVGYYIGLDDLDGEITPENQDVNFGETFVVTVKITRAKPAGTKLRSWTSPTTGVTYSYFHTDLPWTIEGDILGFGVVKPDKIDPLPALTTVTGRTFTIPDVMFECSGGGDTGVGYAAGARLPVREVVEPSQFPDGTETVFVSDHPGARVICLMPKIVASAAPPLTTYNISPDVPAATFYAWSGANCGSTSGTTTKTMVWNHGEEGCEHAGEAHPDATISLFMSGTFPLSGDPWELRCNYTGAASGTGSSCTRIN